MVSRIVALVVVMRIMIMLKELAIQTINAPQFANGATGVNGVIVILTVNKVYEFKDEQIMRILKAPLALAQASDLKIVEILLIVNVMTALINTINAIRYQQVFAQMFVTSQK